MIADAAAAASDAAADFEVETVVESVDEAVVASADEVADSGTDFAVLAVGFAALVAVAVGSEPWAAVETESEAVVGIEALVEHVGRLTLCFLLLPYFLLLLCFGQVPALYLYHRRTRLTLRSRQTLQTRLILWIQRPG
jgi:hypothetical protein